MQCLVLSLGKSCLLKKSIVVTPTNRKVTACPYPKNIRVDYFWHFGNTISSKKSKWCLYLQAKSRARSPPRKGETGKRKGDGRERLNWDKTFLFLCGLQIFIKNSLCEKLFCFFHWKWPLWIIWACQLLPNRELVLGKTGERCLVCLYLPPNIAFSDICIITLVTLDEIFWKVWKLFLRNIGEHCY